MWPEHCIPGRLWHRVVGSRTAYCNHKSPTRCTRGSWWHQLLLPMLGCGKNHRCTLCAGCKQNPRCQRNPCNCLTGMRHTHRMCLDQCLDLVGIHLEHMHHTECMSCRTMVRLGIDRQDKLRKSQLQMDRKSFGIPQRCTGVHWWWLLSLYWSFV